VVELLEGDDDADGELAREKIWTTSILHIIQLKPYSENIKLQQQDGLLSA
jgi:hypothetical protein